LHCPPPPASISLSAALQGTDEQIRATAEPILEKVLDGFFSGDYSRYTRDFDTTAREAATEEKFRAVRMGILERLGESKSRTYLGSLRKGRMTLVLWKGRFTGTQDDVPIKLALTRREERVFVTGFWLQ